MARIRSLIMDPDRAHLVPFNTTDREQELALRLGFPGRGEPEIFRWAPRAAAKSSRKKRFRILLVQEPREQGGIDRGHRADRARKPSMKQLLSSLTKVSEAKVTLLLT